MMNVAVLFLWDATDRMPVSLSMRGMGVIGGDSWRHRQWRSTENFR
jgi:hypothetical protein